MRQEVYAAIKRMLAEKRSDEEMLRILFLEYGVHPDPGKEFIAKVREVAPDPQTMQRQKEERNTEEYKSLSGRFLWYLAGAGAGLLVVLLSDGSDSHVNVSTPFALTHVVSPWYYVRMAVAYGVLVICGIMAAVSFVRLYRMPPPKL